MFSSYVLVLTSLKRSSFVKKSKKWQTKSYGCDSLLGNGSYELIFVLIESADHASINSTTVTLVNMCASDVMLNWCWVSYHKFHCLGSIFSIWFSHVWGKDKWSNWDTFYEKPPIIASEKALNPVVLLARHSTSKSARPQGPATILKYKEKNAWNRNRKAECDMKCRWKMHRGLDRKEKGCKTASFLASMIMWPHCVFQNTW